MAKHEENLINILKNELKSRNNPMDLKPVYIGKVVNLSPVQVSIFDDKIILTEDDDLLISEQFRLRCKIDETTALSSDVPNLLNAAKQVTETHSNGGSLGFHFCLQKLIGNCLIIHDVVRIKHYVGYLCC